MIKQNIWQAWSLVFLHTKRSVLLKNNILHQSKNYKNHFENWNFWGMWPLGHVGHVTYGFINMLFISAGIFDDKLRPQILSVGTTANAASREIPTDIDKKTNEIHKIVLNFSML